MGKQTIGVAVATMGDRISFLKRFFQNSHEAFNYIDQLLIVVQNPLSCIKKDIINILSIVDLHIKAVVIFDKNIGLSRSRNIAIKSMQTDYIWIVDDDVQLCSKNIKLLIALINKQYSDLYTIRVGCSNKKGLYKKYPRKKILTKRNLLKVSSIEIIFNRKFVINNDVKFPIQMGLGAKWPSGEESIFLIDSFKSGASILHIPLVSIMHPCGERNDRLMWSDPNHAISKGIIVRKYGLLAGGWQFLKYIVFIIINGMKVGLIFTIIKGYFIKEDGVY